MASPEFKDMMSAFKDANAEVHIARAGLLSDREFTKLCNAIAEAKEPKAISLRASHKLTHSQIRQLSDAITRGNITSLSLSECETDDPSNWQTLIDALPKSRIAKLWIMDMDFGDENAKRLGDVLPQSRIAELRLVYTKIGHEGIAGLSEGIAKSHRIRILDTQYNPGTDELGAGYVAALNALSKNRSLVEWEFRDKPETPDDPSLDFYDAEYALLHSKGCPSLTKLDVHRNNGFSSSLLSRNLTRANLLLKQMSGRLPKETPLTDRVAIEDRLPLMEVCSVTGFREALADYKIFLAMQVPQQVPSSVRIDDLTAENSFGFTALDNVETWKQYPNLVGELLESGEVKTLDGLCKPITPSGNSLLDYGLALGDAEALMRSLNAHGFQIQGEVLLQEDGTPSRTYEVAMESGNVAALFSYENWEGGSKSELNAVANALPENLRKKVPNLHTLRAQVGRQSSREYER